MAGIFKIFFFFFYNLVKNGCFAQFLAPKMLFFTSFSEHAQWVNWPINTNMSYFWKFQGFSFPNIYTCLGVSWIRWSKLFVETLCTSPLIRSRPRTVVCYLKDMANKSILGKILLFKPFFWVKIDVLSM